MPRNYLAYKGTDKPNLLAFQIIQKIVNEEIVADATTQLYARKELNSTSQPRQPKARAFTRFNERDYLSVAVWPGKTEPAAEVIVVQLRRRNGDEWETVGRLAVYRASDGTYSKLPERK